MTWLQQHQTKSAAPSNWLIRYDYITSTVVPTFTRS